MKRQMPLITLLTGAAIGAVVLIASMLATSTAPTHNAATVTPTSASAASTPPASTSASASAPAATASATAAPSATPVANAPTRADYAGRVHKGHPYLEVSIHDSQAIGYVCNGGVIEAWLKGSAVGGQLNMTGKNGASLNATYAVGYAVGNVVVNGTSYSFWTPAVHKPSGLYRSIAIVRGAKIKAGWIVLPNGTQVGSLESSLASAATPAPVLDVATGTARDGSTVLIATAISGVTGSGF